MKCFKIEEFYIKINNNNIEQSTKIIVAGPYAGCAIRTWILAEFLQS